MRNARVSPCVAEPSAAGQRAGTAASFLDAARDAFFWLRMAVVDRILKPFDREQGTETSRRTNLRRLGVLHPSVPYGVRYQPIDPWLFRRTLRALQAEIFPGEYTFVDLGCGKGRALILAAESGFREVVGIDLAPPLVDCAPRNLARAAVQNARVACQSADAFQFPPGDLVVYLFNPFVGPVFRRTLQNLCRMSSGNTFLVYINPVEIALLSGLTCFEHWKSAAFFSIYRHRPHGAA
jgi:SAM-dependent methyltransferase